MKMIILKNTLKETGGQWRDFKMGVMWTLLFVRVRSLTAEFWISQVIFTEASEHADNSQTAKKQMYG